MLVVRLLVAAGLAGAVGIEREIHEQPAGFRTHTLVGLGAALFTLISAYGFEVVAGIDNPNVAVRADVTRVASQVVVGIGFLGGGAIIKYGATVRGLTTAASLWVTAAIGTAVGVGMSFLAVATTVIVLVALCLALAGVLFARTDAGENLLDDIDAFISGEDSGTTTNTTTPAADGEEVPLVPIASVSAFDPEGDGGLGDENADTAPNAADGDPGTTIDLPWRPDP